ncbi:sugar phosphate isomerase/epimerase family protein [Agromyces cerinus]|uniref:Sugar phosphate isomerase/epimerase n=1 Tax=Agromyces cerinus subsp. cerinus TaxID=232089 RepID=A0A1N6F086_9MICO|nr:sugar phosphate isomerase/epimerase [Agromyces cerinus]SIN88718.1 Sugar phosphate isomerase/epimerase [Agromyces cerinus subsp. cerinus]
MPLAFSTLGAPGVGLADVVSIATRNGVEGVELRAGDGQLVEVRMRAAQRAEVRAGFTDSGIRVLAVAGYVRVCEPGDDGAVVGSLLRHLELAADLGAHAVRVFPGAAGPGADGASRAVRRLAQVSTQLRGDGPRVLIETHDSHPRGRDLRAMLAALDDAVPGHGVGAIWDVFHPWRAGEAPADTAVELAPWLDYVQFKDGTIGGTITGVGDGDLPLDEIAAIVGPDRWWSFEWEKAWHPELPCLDEALPIAAAWYRRRVQGRVAASS